MTLPHMRRLLRALASRLLPSGCALCGQSADALLCGPCCERHLQPARSNCPRCAIEMQDASAPCSRCVASPPAFDACFAAARYVPPVDQLVLALKFRATLPLAAAFAGRLLAAVPSAVSTSHWKLPGRLRAPGNCHCRSMPAFACARPNRSRCCR